MSDLCDKCLKEWWEKERDMNGYVKLIPVATHCHHEPKEKEKCWCQKFEEDSVIKIYANQFYCHQCGRKL